MTGDEMIQLADSGASLPKETVSIRIDRQTLIIVPLEKAPTPEAREAYAERYLQRLKDSDSKRFKSQNPQII